MSTTRLTDLILRPGFTDRINNLTTEKSALVKSGIILPDPVVAQKAKGEGATFTMPHWNDIDGTENVSSDNPAQSATPDNITQGSQSAIKLFRNVSFSSMDLNASFMAGDDPMDRIAALLADLWVRKQQQTFINLVNGVVADNVANDAGDMVINIATDSAGAITAAERISANVVLAAKQTMGDASNKLSTLVLHSALYTELQRQNLISFIPNSQADVGFGTYLGYSLILDDGCPAVLGANRITYTSYLFGRGALAYGEGAPKMPMEIKRDALAGNGGGQETVVSRREFIMHPMGMKWTGSSMAGSSPTNAELATAANWDRVFHRKKIPMVAIKTNG